ncbi:hypothetical protein M513_03808 [Trichuris suis]|uniref:Uncharacterized protein n=1 Tax=Trichuris suis TaxID=68888 RepID=A0A085MD71_9BILA|nr:hypothetical protein M513_03808 [Trichuris suis]
MNREEGATEKCYIFSSILLLLLREALNIFDSSESYGFADCKKPKCSMDSCQLYHSIVGSMTVMVKDPQIDQMLRDFTTAREQLQPTSTFSTLPKIRKITDMR